MLPSLGFSEILILGILALVVVGPKDLPLLLRKLGRWTAKLRGMAQEFRTGFDELARQAELDELKKEVDALRRNTVLTDVTREVTKPLPTLESYAGLPHDVSHAAKTPAALPEPTPAPAPPAAPASEWPEQPKALADDPLAEIKGHEDAPVARSAP